MGITLFKMKDYLKLKETVSMILATHSCLPWIFECGVATREVRLIRGNTVCRSLSFYEFGAM